MRPDLDLRAVAENIRRSDTETLLDRVTVYRDSMEPAALDLIDGELSRRRVAPAVVAEHARRRQEEALAGPDGTVIRCSYCDRPAQARKWGWHRIGGRVPVFPRRFTYCVAHDPAPLPDEGSP